MRTAIGLLFLGILSLAGVARHSADVTGGNTIYAAYFYAAGCQPCSGAENNVQLLHSQYPQLDIQEFDTKQDEALGKWLARRAGRSDFNTPALFIGDQAWIGEVELFPASVQAALDQNPAQGAIRVWDEAAPIRWRAGIAQNSPVSAGAIGIAFGLVDGLIPAAVMALLFLEVAIMVYKPYGHTATPELIPSRGDGTMSFAGSAGSAVSISTYAIGMFVAISALSLAIYDNPIRIESWLAALRAPGLILIVVAGVSLALAAFVQWTRSKQAQSSGSLPITLHRPSRGWALVATGAASILIALLSIAGVGRAFVPALIYLYSLFTAPLQAYTAGLFYDAFFVLPLVVILVLVYRWFFVGAPDQETETDV
jgi:hypothetical protein